MRIWELFPELTEAVRKSHEEVGLVGHGHDIYHAKRVAEYAQQIGRDEYDIRTGELAGIAGLCHNADRILEKKYNIIAGQNDVPRKEVIELIAGWLSIMDLNDEEKKIVLDAILAHNRKNDEGNHPVLICLMDADRVVNLEEDHILRSAQYYPDLPAVDIERFINDPEATYHNPKSVLRDIAYCLDWVTPGSGVCVRTHLGKKLAEERAVFVREFIARVKLRLRGVGLRP